MEQLSSTVHTRSWSRQVTAGLNLGGISYDTYGINNALVVIAVA